MTELENLLHLGLELGEGPLWSVEEQALYWVNISAGEIHRWDYRSNQHSLWNIGLPVGMAVFQQAGGFVLATQKGFAFWKPGGKAEFILDPEAGRKGARFNDGAVDRRGRFWAGTIDNKESPTSSLYRLDADRSVRVMETGIAVSNGIGWSGDNRTMYYTDSPTRKIFAYDFDLGLGTIRNRRIFVEVPPEEGVPDGLAVDADGYIWSAHWDGWKVVRYTPDGKIERVIDMPVQRPTSCAFGGPNLDELFITSAWEGLSPAEKKAQPLAGDLFRLKVGVKGLPVTPYGAA